MRKLSSILSWASLISAFALPFIALKLGGDYGIAGIDRYCWIGLLGLPLSIACIWCGIVHKRRHEPYGNNFAAGIFSLIIIFAMVVPVLPQRGLYDDAALQAVTEVSGITFPQNAKAATTDYIQYQLCIATLDSDNKSTFEEQIRSDKNWTDSLNPAIKHLLPEIIQMTYLNSESPFDYYLFQNLNTAQYNEMPTLQGDIPCFLIAYDVDSGRVIAVYDYTIAYH